MLRLSHHFCSAPGAQTGMSSRIPERTRSGDSSRSMAERVVAVVRQSVETASEAGDVEWAGA